jgi:hypothetical protein
MPHGSYSRSRHHIHRSASVLGTRFKPWLGAFALNSPFIPYNERIDMETYLTRTVFKCFKASTHRVSADAKPCRTYAAASLSKAGAEKQFRPSSHTLFMSASEAYKLR